MEGDPPAVEQSENGQNGHQSEQVNGVSNGYSGDSKHHKSSHKDKHRDREHRKDHKSSRDKDRHSSSNKDKDRSKDHKSSRDKDREREKERDKDREKERSDRDKDKHRSDKDKDRSKSSSSKDHKSSSSSHHISSRDKDKHKSSSSHDKHKSSSSSSKDKDRKERSDKDRSERSDKDRSDKDRKSSSSKHHSSSRDKDRGDRKHRDEKREKHKSEKEENGEQPKEELPIKEEEPYPQEDVNHSTASSCDYNMSQFNKSEPQFETTNGAESQEDVSQDDEESQDDEDKLEIKEEDESQASEDEVPLASRVSTPIKRQHEEDDDEEDIPLAARKKVKKEKKKEKKAKKRAIESEEEEEYNEKPKKAKIKKEKVQVKQEIKKETASPGKKKKGKKEEEPEVWKWWEEEKKDDGTKWNFLEHKGPVFAPPYERLPENVKFYYDGKEIRLSQDAEEVAGFYAKMLEHDYTSKDVFNNNFFKDWRKVMTDKERAVITKLEKCNFKPMHAYFMDVAEKNRNRTKEEKEALKAQNAEILEEYGFCTIDGHKEKIGNFRIEPPGLFRGRGEHPKMGMLKKRVNPEDISINCAKKSKIPEAPPGHKWKDVRHDQAVTWLCSWTENVQNQVKYIMLNPSSKLKGEKDWQKYETARRLAKNIDKIREDYRNDWKSKEMRIRQRAVALYFIDKLALRAGNEKDEDQADTVGCCSLRVEHISLEEHKDGKDYVVIFDFLGKDSIRYYNEVPVEKRVFKNLQLFMENKAPGDDLFDRLNTTVMNKHLNELMDGLSAKVFRTYNASWTLQQQLDELTNEDDSIAEKILSYNRANRAVAILCNHQRSVPKGHQKSMEKLKEKIDLKRDQIADGEKQVKDAKRSAKGGSVKERVNYDKKKKMLERLKDQLKKLEVQETDRDENKSIALGTSKLNYLDPRISVAWCKKYDVPLDKVYNKTQRDKFRWAIDMATADYVF